VPLQRPMGESPVSARGGPCSRCKLLFNSRSSEPGNIPKELTIDACRAETYGDQLNISGHRVRTGVTDSSHEARS